MNYTVADASGLERWLAGLLHYGTRLAAGMVAAGLAMALWGPWAREWPPMSDIMRLILMLGVFLHQRDYRFSAITALVLMIVLVGSMIGAV
jgi:uncharacterized membrane protein